MTTTTECCTVLAADGFGDALADVAPEAAPWLVLFAVLLVVEWIAGRRDRDPDRDRPAARRFARWLAELDPAHWPPGPGAGADAFPPGYGVDRDDCGRITAAGPCHGSTWNGGPCDRCGR